MFSAPETTVYMNGFPEGWLLGIDLAFFNTTSNFKGIKLIPSGLHVIHWGADSSTLRTARFLIAETNSLFVIQWCNVKETASYELDLGELDLSAIKARVASGMYSYMSNYPTLLEAKSISYWTRITQSITPNVLDQVLGLRWTCDSASYSLEEHAQLERALNQKFEHHDSVSTLDFTNIDTKRTWPPGAQGAQLTQHARDTSWYLISLINGRFAGQDQVMFGHLQLSYIILIILANYSACVFYVALVEVMIRCRIDMKDHRFRFRAFFDLLALHLQHFPLDNFTGQSKLRQAFADLQEDLNSGDLELDPVVAQSAMSCLRLAKPFLLQDSD